MGQKMQRKLEFLRLQLAFAYYYFLAFCVATFSKKKKTNAVRSIAAFWYYPVALPGSNLRMGNWKPFFEEKGITFENFSLYSLEEYRKKYENADWTQRYVFYRLILKKRYAQFKQVRNFDAVWIGRSFIPVYPLKIPFFEKQIKKMGVKVIVDTYDGSDYNSNPGFIEKTMHNADHTTIAFKTMESFYREKGFSTHKINWVFPTEDYPVKTQYSIDSIPVIGWMGSPANFKHVLELKDTFKALAKEIDFKLVYLCREKFDFTIADNITIEHHYFNDAYYSILASFDIGISPYFSENNSIMVRGKIGMKHQEFMTMAVPQICSPFGITEFVEHKENVWIANSKKEWHTGLLRLLKEEKLREKLGANYKKIFDQHYTYKNEFSKVFKALTSFEEN